MKIFLRLLAEPGRAVRHALRTLRLSLPLAIALVSTTVVAGTARDLTWDDLVPPSTAEVVADADRLQAQFDALDQAEQDGWLDVRNELMLKRALETRLSNPLHLPEAQRRLLDDPPSAKLPQAVVFWREVEELNARMTAEEKRIVPELDGQQVSIPGYLLPLEFERGQVREFLLVPFVGACIHVPPPPANQMVFVRTDTPYTSEQLFEAVVVEGKLATQAGTYDLTLVDGQAPVEASYAMQAMRIRPHER